MIARSKTWFGAKSAIVALTAAAVCGPSATSVAQQRDPVAAEALFREGRELVKKGDYPTACLRFGASYRLDPSAGSLLNLADCEDHIGKVASAWQHYRALVQNLGPDDERVTFAKQRLPELEKRLPHVTISIAPNAPKDTKVVRDEVELGEGSLGVSLPVDPGSHVVVATATRHEPKKYEFTIKEQETQTLTVEPGEEKPEEVAPVPSGGVSTIIVQQQVEQPPLTPAAKAGYVIGGLGVAGIVVGAVAGIIVLDKKNTVDSDCHGGSVCDSENGVNASRQGKSWSIVSTAAFGLGAVALAGGTYLVLSERNRASASVAPTTGGATFMLRKEF